VASYTTKPADLDTLAQVFAKLTAGMGRSLHVLLVIASDPARRDAIMAALAGPDRSFEAVASGAEALEALRRGVYQGIVVEVDLPREDGIAVLERIRAEPGLPRMPAILYTERRLRAEELERVARLDATVVGDPGHPLDVGAAEIAGFLQRVLHALPPAGRPGAAAGSEHGLAGRRVMIVDDDVRNLFALTGLLENQGMRVDPLESGEAALRHLDAHPEVDLVLMDIMMPVMDGYETIRRIRADPRFAVLPVIALTAKAMLEDRAKCLAAGASDYATKPVDTGQLLAQLRIWRRREQPA
jgi:CheY-like chemotaxis protein